MDAARFLDELEPLHNHDRVRRMLDVGRRAAAAGDAEARALTSALFASDDAYARCMALHTVFTSRDGALAARACRDPSRRVRRLALGLLALAGSDEEVIAAAAAIEVRADFARLVCHLRARRRTTCVDAVLRARLAATPDNPDPRVVDLLGHGSAALGAEHIDLVRRVAGPSAWIGLARAPGSIVVAEILDALDRPQAADMRMAWRISLLLPTLVEHSPDDALSIVRRLLARGDDPGGYQLRAVIAGLVRKRPVEVFDLLRARQEKGPSTTPPGPFAGVRFDTVARRLDAPRLAWLIEHAWDTLSDGHRARRWFLRLDEERREAVLDAWLRRGRGAWGAFLLARVDAGGPRADLRERAFARWSHAARNTNGVIDPGRLEPLPPDLRHREARRHLDEVSWLRSRPRERMQYARLLPFEDARAVLQPFLGHPEGEERAAALSTLIAAVRFDRARVPAALETVLARRFEQDPVRLAMLTALGALPVRCFRPDDLAGVGQAVRHALDAADCSPATAAAVERLVVRLFRVDAGWGARWLTAILEVRGHISALGLGDALSDREVAPMVPALADLAATWATRERAFALIWLAASFGRRLHAITPLLDALERLARELPFIGVAASALGLLRRHAAERFLRLVPALLDEDRSFIALPEVARHVSVKRQDLLSPFLDGRTMTGRFASGRTHWVIDFTAGHGRWTSRQQHRYGETLSLLIAEEKRDVPTLRFALSTLALLGFAPSSLLVAFAADPRQPVREIAIRALPWLDAGQGVPALVEALGDDRARWAIYALRKAFAEMPRGRVIEILGEVPTTKVTVAKEVVRLLGEMRGEDAYQRLLAIDRPGLHRDVRIALLRALWDHLDREETWERFARAAADPDWVIASRLADIPLGRLSPDAEARVLGLLVTILARPEPEARLALLGRAATLPLTDGDRRLFRRCVEHVGVSAEDESVAALRAVFARMRPGEADEVAAKLIELAPRRRRLLALLDVVLGAAGPYAPEHQRAIARRLMDHLATDPLAVVPYLRAAGQLLAPRDLGRALIDLAGRGLLHADAMEAARAAVNRSVSPSTVEEMLGHAEDPDLRRLGLEALRTAAAPNRGWTPERRARLRHYRDDPAPLVAEAAWFTFPPDEDPGDAPRPETKPPAPPSKKSWWRRG